MIRRVTLLVMSLLIGSVAFSPQTYAHTLEKQGSIGVVLHVDPSDEPVSGSLSTMFFEIQDSSHNFSLASCRCQVKITTAGKTVLVQQLTTGYVKYTFPAPAVYQLEVSGSPYQPDKFQSFSIKFDQRIEQGTDTANTFSPFLAAILLAAVGIGLMVLIILSVNYRANNKKGKEL